MDIYETILLIVALGILGLVAVEGVLYWVNRRRFSKDTDFLRSRKGFDLKNEIKGWAMSDPYLGFRNLPGGNYASTNPEKGVYGRLQIDTHGFVSNSSLAPVRSYSGPDKFNIFITGGSTAVGCQATSNEATYAAQLELSLKRWANENSFDREIQIINAGVGGYNSSQELIYFLFDLKFLKPDLWIMFNGINDNWFIDELYMQGSSDWHQNFRVRPTSSQTWFPSATYFLERLEARLSKTSYSEEASERAGYKDNPESVFPASDRYLSNISSAASLARGAKCSFAYFLQPTLGYGSKQETEGERKLRLSFQDETQQQNWPRYLDRLQRFYSAVENGLPNLRSSFSDYPNSCFETLADMFSEEEKSVYVDPRHYNDYGQSLIAEEMMTRIVPLLEKKEP